MAQNSQSDGYLVVIVDKDTGEARVSWDGESAQLGLPKRDMPLPMPERSDPNTRKPHDV